MATRQGQQRVERQGQQQSQPARNQQVQQQQRSQPGVIDQQQQPPLQQQQQQQKDPPPGQGQNLQQLEEQRLDLQRQQQINQQHQNPQPTPPIQQQQPQGQQPQQHEYQQQFELEQYPPYPPDAPPDTIILASSRSSLSSPWGLIPPGWETATSPVDGRIYYWEVSTGRTSWAHPLAHVQPNNGNMNLPSPPPPPPPPPEEHGVSKEILLPHPPPPHPPPQGRPNRVGGRRNNINPFHGWGQFLHGGYQSAIPSSASVSSHGSGSRQISRAEWHETPITASRRPSSHQCQTMVGFILFPPLGVCAFMHSFQVDRAWRQGRYADAYTHSKLARSYSTFACWIGLILWIYWLFFREGTFQFTKNWGGRQKRWN